MKKYEVGQTVTVKLSGGRIVEAEIKAIRDTTEGVRLPSKIETRSTGVRWSAFSHMSVLPVY